MESGSKKTRVIASQTSETPVSGGKGWQIYASCFDKNKESGCKTMKSRVKLCIQNKRNLNYGGQTFQSQREHSNLSIRIILLFISFRGLEDGVQVNIAGFLQIQLIATVFDHGRNKRNRNDYVSCFLFAATTLCNIDNLFSDGLV